VKDSGGPNLRASTAASWRSKRVRSTDGRVTACKIFWYRSLAGVRPDAQRQRQGTVEVTGYDLGVPSTTNVVVSTGSDDTGAVG
jgi:hypothetical protein